MIIGIGIDLCKISRMARAARSRHFLERVFTPEEIAWAESKNAGHDASLAAAFAAREAFCKASGVPLATVTLGSGFSLVHEPNGRPVIKLSDEITALLPTGTNVHVSLSHDGDIAAAVVVLETYLE